MHEVFCNIHGEIFSTEESVCPSCFEDWEIIEHDNVEDETEDKVKEENENGKQNQSSN